MANMNIGSANAGDAFYRYKMPKLEAKIEGRGNGIKTNIVNLVDISKCLGRPATYTTKYFGCELGAQTKFEEDSGLAIVNGAHDGRKLQDMLDGFITRFVLCGKCNNPETVLEITKQQTILKNCKACGAVSKVDMRHKLTTFILKNPPPKKNKKDKYKDKEKEELARKAEKKARKAAKRMEEEEGLTEEEKKAKKEERKREKEARKEAKKSKRRASRAAEDEEDDDAQDDDDDEEEDDDDVEWTTDTSKEAAERRAKEQLTAAAAAMVIEEGANGAPADGEEEEDEDDEEEDDEDEIVEKLRSYAASHSPAEVAAVLKTVPSDDGARTQVRILFHALFDTESPLLSQMKAKLAVLQRAVAPAGAPGQLSFLCATEQYLADRDHAQLKYTAHILKFLYDEDVVEEESMIGWADAADCAKRCGVAVDAARSAAVRKAAAQIIEWLKNAESDDED